MTNPQLDEEAVFHVARELHGAPRAAYLDQICAGDAALRERVETLLKVYEDEQSFLKSAARPVAPTADFPAATEKPGAIIGRYKLMEQIGEGGMGVVFVAEQDRPIRRKVALKVIKPGMDSKAVVGRFEAERQALAMMDHPNIAKVLDAGTTDSGRPYFAMELVKGIPITNYCDMNRLTIRERMELFIEVCQAIQHAHQKGIIHRDVKPSNVLVTLHDGRPVPKVIDFGVAKALNARLTDKTVYTEHFQVIGTLLYMSPEQAEMSGLDIDTRSDIYSLGVLLYELLTGTTPFQQHDLDKAGFDEQRRIIREMEPPRASVRISSLGETATTVADCRQTEPRKLNQLLRGDLDWVVLKALEKDRTRRYETANSLARDVSNYLESEPVDARPPTVGYRAAKYLKRHRVAIAVMGLVFASLSFGLVLTAWQARIAAEREEEANTLANSLREERDQYSALVEQFHVLLIEKALQLAVLGEVNAIDEIVSQATRMGVPEDWVLTLRGAAHLHQGDNAEAQQLLQRAIATNPENVSARAMLANALYHSGDVTKWSEHMPDFPAWQPRPKYEEFDRLFLAYARFYVSFDDSRQELEAVLRGHPTWVVAQALLAGAWAETAIQKDDRSCIENALRQLDDLPRAVVEKNPFVQVASLFVCNAAMLVLEDDLPDSLQEKANGLAEQLAAHTTYPLAMAIRADHYELVDEPELSWLARRPLLTNGAGFFVSWTIAEAYQRDHIQEILDAKPTDPEAKIAQAFVMAGIPERREDARKVYEDVSANNDTWYIRYQLAQLLLLLQEPDEAKRMCFEWTEPGVTSGSIVNEDLYRKAMKYVAGRPSTFDTGSPNSNEPLHAHYTKALVAYAKKDTSEALSQLSLCQEARSLGGTRRWARAFATQWSKLDGDTGQERDSQTAPSDLQPPVESAE